ncbi:uncharacterized protein LOC109533401 [Dendroctonus ponderosae]|nr:uncharacterized protein LOC109533401 [Dendroctonus ponderosae]KAH1026846.1 hypothetical protein HUJ05_000459 [Dendroctonus ponderosae]
MFKLALFQLVLATVVLIVAARPQGEAKKLNAFSKTQLNKEAKGTGPKQPLALNKELNDSLLNHPDKDSSSELNLGLNALNEDLNDSLLNHPNKDSSSELNLGLNALNEDLNDSLLNNPDKDSSHEHNLGLNNLIQNGKETRKSLLNKLNAVWKPKSLLNSLGLNSYLNAQRNLVNVESEEGHQGKQRLNSLLSKLDASSAKPFVGISSVFSTVHISSLNEERKPQAEDLLLALNEAKALEEIPA